MDQEELRTIAESMRQHTFSGNEDEKIAVWYLGLHKDTWNALRREGYKNESTYVQIFTNGLISDAGLWKSQEVRKDFFAGSSIRDVGIDIWFERFREKYVPESYIRKCLNELYGLKERGNVMAYIRKFEELESIVGNEIHPDEADRIFIKGLSVKNKLECMDILKDRKAVVKKLLFAESLREEDEEENRKPKPQVRNNYKPNRRSYSHYSHSLFNLVHFIHKTILTIEDEPG